MARDMSEKQFRKKLEAMGFENSYFMGYWRLPKPLNNVSVSGWNGGRSRREQLAYLIERYEKHRDEVA